jgi:phosphoglycerol transferase MdoB-like AlkP superfamily enzyme
VVLVQNESFFDGRRVHPSIPRDLLPVFDQCCRTGVQSGHLGVSAWGGTTTRTEFAVLTGLSDEALGFDRFNPYHAFARVPIASMAWRMRARGYRTVCIHPFDRTYYSRDRVMANLGFDAFLGEEAFAGAERNGAYVSDQAVARLAAELLREEGSGLFLMAITMGNHAPWLAGDPRGIGIDPAPALPSVAEDAALKCFLNGLKSADAMLGIVRDALQARREPGLLALYGDHLPSLPASFKELGFADTRTDYVVWTPGGGPGSRIDLSAHQLFDVVNSAALRRSALAYVS